MSRPERIDSPSAAVHLTARRRHQLAMESFQPGTVTMGGTDYAAAVRSAGAAWEVVDGGRRDTERCVAMIDKRVLTVAPLLGSTFEYGEKAFKVVEVGGINATDASWVVRGMVL
jgi:hypothetical protein